MTRPSNHAPAGPAIDAFQYVSPPVFASACSARSIGLHADAGPTGCCMLSPRPWAVACAVGWCSSAAWPSAAGVGWPRPAPRRRAASQPPRRARPLARPGRPRCSFATADACPFLAPAGRCNRSTSTAPWS